MYKENVINKIKPYLNRKEEEKIRIKMFGNNIFISIGVKKNRANLIKDNVVRIFNASDQNVENNIDGFLIKIDTNNYVELIVMVNSHILIPEFILKKFVNNTPNSLEIDYYDFATNSYNKEKTKNFNASLGYFRESVEQFLQIYENRLGNIHKYIMEDKEIYDLDVFQTIKEYIAITMMRNKDIVEYANSKSIMSKVIGNFDSNDIFYLFKKHGIPKEIFKDFNVYSIKNTTDEKFLLNETMLTELNDGFETIIMPISPNIIFIVSKNIYEESIIYDTKIAIDINKAILYNAYQKKEKVIGDKSTIDKVRELIKDKICNVESY